MTCAIMQPTYIPWLGYFDLINKSNYFVFYDDVQFVKQSWQSRNKIKAGVEEQILTVPIKKTAHFSDLFIKDVKLDNEKPWCSKHLKSIQQNYSKAKYFDEIFPQIEPVYFQNYDSLAEFNIHMITLLSRIMGIETKFMKSSEINISKGTKEDGIIAICKFLKANNYISPKGAFSYLNNDVAERKFSANNILVYFQNFKVNTYSQRGKNFIPYLSSLDALFNIGGEATISLIRESSLNYSSYSDLINLSDEN